jgi:hypothetical protein
VLSKCCADALRPHFRFVRRLYATSETAVLLQLCCNEIAKAAAAVSVNKMKWLVVHMHVVTAAVLVPRGVSQCIGVRLTTAMSMVVYRLCPCALRLLCCGGRTSLTDWWSASALDA